MVSLTVLLIIHEYLYQDSSECKGKLTVYISFLAPYYVCCKIFSQIVLTQIYIYINIYIYIYIYI